MIFGHSLGFNIGVGKWVVKSIDKLIYWKNEDGNLENIDESREYRLRRSLKHGNGLIGICSDASHSQFSSLLYDFWECLS